MIVHWYGQINLAPIGRQAFQALPMNWYCILSLASVMAEGVKKMGSGSWVDED